MSILELIAKLKEIEGVIDVTVDEDGILNVNVSDAKYYPEVKRFLEEESGLNRVKDKPPPSRNNPHAN